MLCPFVCAAVFICARAGQPAWCLCTKYTFFVRDFWALVPYRNMETSGIFPHSCSLRRATVNEIERPLRSPTQLRNECVNKWMNEWNIFLSRATNRFLQPCLPLFWVATSWCLAMCNFPAAYYDIRYSKLEWFSFFLSMFSRSFRLRLDLICAYPHQHTGHSCTKPASDSVWWIPIFCRIFFILVRFISELEI